jgi:hypothetical protein
LKIEIDGQKIKARLDYQVKQGTTTSEGISVRDKAYLVSNLS